MQPSSEGAVRWFCLQSGLIFRSNLALLSAPKFTGSVVTGVCLLDTRGSSELFPRIRGHSMALSNMDDQESAIHLSLILIPELRDAEL